MSSLPRFVLQPKMMSKNTKLAGGRLEMECKLRDPEMQRNLEGENGERERERETRFHYVYFCSNVVPFFSFSCCCDFLCRQIKKHHIYHFVSEKLKPSVKFYFLKNPSHVSLERSLWKTFRVSSISHYRLSFSCSSSLSWKHCKAIWPIDSRNKLLKLCSKLLSVCLGGLECLEYPTVLLLSF